MSELDDLLGSGKPEDDLLGGDADLLGDGPSGGDIDDLLSGDPQGTADDLLFADPIIPTEAPIPARPRAHHTISIPPIANPSVSLKPFVTPTTYFARFVSVVERDRKRNKKVLTVTDHQVSVVNTDEKVERSIPLSTVVGVVSQNIHTSKLFGGKESEIHIVVQVKSDKDLYFVLISDPANGDVSSMVDLLQVLSALCLKYNEPLPVSQLKDNESIETVVNWAPQDDRLRREYSEALAYRTELLAELAKISKLDSQLDSAICNLKNSDAATAAAHLKGEIHSLEVTITEFANKNEELERWTKDIEDQKAKLEADLLREEKKRSDAVKETLEATAQEALMRQVSEYEMMKRAHKREVDKIVTLTNINERRQKSRAPSAGYSGSQTVLKRIDVLEDEDAYVCEKIAEMKEAHPRTLAVLTNSKKQVAQGKEVLAALLDDIRLLKGKLEDFQSNPGGFTPLARDVNRNDPPRIAPLPINAKKEADVVPATPAPAPPPAAKINLDDDDDI